MKKHTLGIKFKDIITALTCLAIAFLLWLYSNIQKGGI